MVLADDCREYPIDPWIRPVPGKTWCCLAHSAIAVYAILITYIRLRKAFIPRPEPVRSWREVPRVGFVLYFPGSLSRRAAASMGKVFSRDLTRSHDVAPSSVERESREAPHRQPTTPPHAMLHMRFREVS